MLDERDRIGPARRLADQLEVRDPLDQSTKPDAEHREVIRDRHPRPLEHNRPHLA